jgi:hypothetical protein
MSRKTIAALGLALAILLLASCGESPTPAAEVGSGDPSPSSRASEEESPDEGSVATEIDESRPPPVVIGYGDESAELEAWTFCYGNMCADGAPPEDLVDVGSPDEVFVEFPLDDWRFTAEFRASGDDCARIQSVPLEDLGDGRFVVRPAGHAGTYDVTLAGRGDGDLFVTFRWTTPTDGPLPKPRSRMSVLAGHDGEVDSYSVELSLENMATTPKDASATITVEASNGESLTFDAHLDKSPCRYEGSLYWDGPDDAGKEAINLGDPPFTYTVVVVLDGERYEAQATWPDDVIKGFSPNVRLRFSPSLPALQ